MFGAHLPCTLHYCVWPRTTLSIAPLCMTLHYLVPCTAVTTLHHLVLTYHLMSGVVGGVWWECSDDVCINKIKKAGAGDCFQGSGCWQIGVALCVGDRCFCLC